LREPPEDLPNLLVTGAMRSGTTTAYRVLSQHPEIFMAPWKEPHFLALGGRQPTFSGPGDDAMNRNAIVDEDAYRGLFREAAGFRWRGEASATYLYMPEAVAGIKDLLGAPKLLVFLRDPVDRALSAYQYLRGREPLGEFTDALAAEEERIAAGWNPMWHYLAAGHYRPQLERFLEAFPRSQIHLALFEDLSERPDAVFGQIFAWLGVEQVAVDAQAHNRSGVARSRAVRLALRPNRFSRRVGRVVPEPVKRPLRRVREANMKPALSVIEPETRRRLAARFSDDVEFVESLTGHDLSAWRA
jgi:hypothetical protein